MDERISVGEKSVVRRLYCISVFTQIMSDAKNVISLLYFMLRVLFVSEMKLCDKQVAR